MPDINTIVKVLTAAGFVAVPVITVWAGLDWYFKRGEKSTKAIFIAIAGVESSVLYSYFVFTEPSRTLIFVSIGWYCGLSVATVVLYYGLYAACDGKADQAGWWLLPLALVSYVILFSTIAIFCAAVLARHEYLILGGHVFSNSKPLSGATLIVQDAENRPIRTGTTDLKGLFLLTLKYGDYEKNPKQKPAHLLIQADGYSDSEIDLDGHPNENLEFSLTPETASKP